VEKNPGEENWGRAPITREEGSGMGKQKCRESSRERENEHNPKSWLCIPCYEKHLYYYESLARIYTCTSRGKYTKNPQKEYNNRKGYYTSKNY
jgi:hypothetical protein